MRHALNSLGSDKPMLKITIHRDDQTTLDLEGKLSGPWVGELERTWRAELENTPAPSITVVLRAVSYVDPEGKALLQEIERAGTQLQACECMTRALVEEIARAHEHFVSASRKIFKKVFSLFFLLTVLGGASHLRAQDLPPLKLTLSEAVRLALKQNPQVQIAALNLAQSQQDKAVALSALLPKAQLGVSDAVLRGNVETAFGKRVPGFPQVIGPFEIFNAGTQFSAPVFDLTLWRRWQASREGVAANDAARQSVREQVVLLVVSQYLGCLRAGADVRAAQSRVNLAQALYDQALDLQQHGVGTGIDTLRANVELQNEKQRLILAETFQETSFYGLARLLNLDPRQSIELGDQLSFFETPASEAEQGLDPPTRRGRKCARLPRSSAPPRACGAPPAIPACPP